MHKPTVATTTKAGLGMDDILTPVRAKILKLAAQHGVSNVRVFGSVARGEARPDSDVDFLVDAPPGKELSAIGGFAEEVEALLGRKVDVSTVELLRMEFKRIVPRDAKAL